MRDVSASPLFNVADPSSKRRLMREAVAALEPNPDLAFVLLHVVSAFIDGLAAGAKGDTKAAYLKYLKANFPALCKAIGAEVFYTHIRSKAVHEFALLPPLALVHSSALADPTSYVETVIIDDKEWTLVNLEKVVADFRSHLDALSEERLDAQAT
jgi:hypothetical protein